MSGAINTVTEKNFSMPLPVPDVARIQRVATAQPHEAEAGTPAQLSFAKQSDGNDSLGPGD